MLSYLNGINIKVCSDDYNDKLKNNMKNFFLKTKKSVVDKCISDYKIIFNELKKFFELEHNVNIKETNNSINKIYRKLNGLQVFDKYYYTIAVMLLITAYMNSEESSDSNNVWNNYYIKTYKAIIIDIYVEMYCSETLNIISNCGVPEPNEAEINHFDPYVIFLLPIIDVGAIINENDLIGMMNEYINSNIISKETTIRNYKDATTYNSIGLDIASSTYQFLISSIIDWLFPFITYGKNRDMVEFKFFNYKETSSCDKAFVYKTKHDKSEIDKVLTIFIYLLNLFIDHFNLKINEQCQVIRSFENLVKELKRRLNTENINEIRQNEQYRQAVKERNYSFIMLNYYLLFYCIYTSIKIAILKIISNICNNSKLYEFNNFTNQDSKQVKDKIKVNIDKIKQDSGSVLTDAYKAYKSYSSFVYKNYKFTNNSNDNEFNLDIVNEEIVGEDADSWKEFFEEDNRVKEFILNEYFQGFATTGNSLYNIRNYANIRIEDIDDGSQVENNLAMAGGFQDVDERYHIKFIYNQKPPMWLDCAIFSRMDLYKSSIEELSFFDVIKSPHVKNIITQEDKELIIKALNNNNDFIVPMNANESKIRPNEAIFNPMLDISKQREEYWKAQNTNRNNEYTDESPFRGGNSQYDQFIDQVSKDNLITLLILYNDSFDGDYNKSVVQYTTTEDIVRTSFAMKIIFWLVAILLIGLIVYTIVKLVNGDFFNKKETKISKPMNLFRRKTSKYI